MLGRGCWRVALSGLIVAACAISAAPAAAITVTEFTQGLAAAPSPGPPAAGPDGNVWFTDNGAVGRITPAGVITEYKQGIPSGDTPANSITLGSDGALWFCLDGMSPAIGRIDPATGAISHFATTSDPRSVTTGPDGNVWFIGGAGMATGAIGYITPAGAITEITTGFSGISPDPEAIAPGPDGNMWFLDVGNPYAVGHVNLKAKPYSLSETTTGVDPLAVLGNLTAGPDSNVWFTANGYIGKVTPQGTVTEIPAGTDGLQSGAQPDEIMTGPDNNLWFDDQYSGFDAIGKIIPATSAITEYPLKTATTPWTMTFGADGNAYVTQTGLVAQMTTSGKVTEFPTTSNMSGMDNDSMLQGPDGNVYYNDFGTPPAIVQVNLNAKPVATTGAATAITASGATVAGSVTPLSAATTVSFQYGTTTALGSTASAGNLAASTGASPVSAGLTGLPASTRIYYEVQATNANGTVAGAMQSFTTTAAPGGGTPPPPPSVVTAHFGDQLLTLTTPSTRVCTARPGTLRVTFTSTVRRGARPRLRFVRVAFFIDKGNRHTHRRTVHRGGKRRTVTVFTYRANATRHAAPTTVRLALGTLSTGAHRLTVKVTYRQAVGRRGHRHKRIRTTTLRARFSVC